MNDEIVEIAKEVFCDKLHSTNKKENIIWVYEATLNEVEEFHHKIKANIKFEPESETLLGIVILC